MKIALLLSLFVVSASRAAYPDVMLIDGTLLRRVRFLFIAEPARSVFLVHLEGVCNRAEEDFPKSALKDVEVRIADDPRESVRDLRNRPLATEEEQAGAVSRELDTPKNGPVNVRGYNRKNGTEVKSHTRSAPGLRE